MKDEEWGLRLTSLILSSSFLTFFIFHPSSLDLQALSEFESESTDDDRIKGVVTVDPSTEQGRIVDPTVKGVVTGVYLEASHGVAFVEEAYNLSIPILQKCYYDEATAGRD